MIWFVVAQSLGLLVDLIAARRRSPSEKDLGIALLGHQLRLLQRRHPQPPRLTRRVGCSTTTTSTSRDALLARRMRFLHITGISWFTSVR